MGGAISQKERNLTMTTAIVIGSGHYPNDDSGYYLWQRPLPERWQRPLSIAAAAGFAEFLTQSPWYISVGRAGGIIMPHALVRFHGRNAP